MLGRQSLDFYLLEYKIAIECQGQQHFKPVDFGNKGCMFSDLEFKKILKMDKKKYDKCVENYVDVLYFTKNINCINGDYLATVYTNKIDLLKKIKENEKKLL